MALRSLTKKNLKLSVSKYLTVYNMECKTNRESVRDLEEDLEKNSDVALWKYIGPKIGEARNILFSAILDILDKSKSEEHIPRRDSLNSIHWKNAKKSIWTLSTTTDRQGSLRNVHLDSSVFQVLDNLSCTTDNKGTSRQSFNFRNQSTQNLEKVVLGRKNAVCVRLNRKTKKSTDIAELSMQKTKHVGTSSIGLFSQDSIASKKSYYSVKRKKNLVIKCDYSNKSPPLSKHVLQVYQHQSSQVVPEEKSTNVSNEKLLVDHKEISKNTKGEPRESKLNIANTNTVNMSLSNITSEKRKHRKSRRHKKSLQHKWSFMSLNRRRVNGGKHGVESDKTSAQSTSYRAKFSRILSKLFNAGLQFSSISHRKDIEKRNHFIDSSRSVTSSSSNTTTLSVEDFRNSSKYSTSKRQDLPKRRSSNIPHPEGLSYNNIPCAAPLFVPILNLPGPEQCKKEIKKPCKLPDDKSSINSSFRLYPRSSKTRKFIDSFCGLKSRILASASRGKAPDIPTPPSSSRTSIFSTCNSKSKYDLNRSNEKLPPENRLAFSPTRREENRRESPTSRFEIPNGLRYERHHSPKIVASEIENPRRPTFHLPQSPVIVENWDSSNSDLAYSDNSFTLLSKEAFFSNKLRNKEPCCTPERKYSYDALRHSIPPPNHSSPEDVFSTRHLYERPKVNRPYSPPSSENEFHYQNAYYPYQYNEYPNTSDEHMYYWGENAYPQYVPHEIKYPPSSMFSGSPSFLPSRPISCPLPGKLPNLPPYLIAPQPPTPYYGTDPYSPPFYSYTGSQSYFVDPFSSFSTTSQTSSGSSVHYPLDPREGPYSYRHDIPPTRSLREHLWYPYGQKVFDYQKYPNPDDREEFARFGNSRSLSVPAYPVESFGSEYLPDSNYSGPKVQRRRMPKYMEYPHPVPQGPLDFMHPSNQHYYPQLSEYPRELTHPSQRYHSRKHLRMDMMNRSDPKRRCTKSSCHSILLDQRISTRKGTGHGRQLAHSSSSLASITINSSPKFDHGSSSGSCSDVSVCKSSATILLSKYKSIDGKYKYQYRSSCTSSKTQTSESIVNFQNNKKPKKRVSCDCSKSRSKHMPLQRNEFNAKPRHHSLYHCKRNEFPSASYRNMIGLRSQVCSSATDVYWNFRLKYGKIKHFNDRIKFELQKIGIDQLIEASKPAKCCKQTILNQPAKGNLPYAASLASLPLDDTDIKVIKQSVKMASKKKDFNSGDCPENRKKLTYYANILTDDYKTRKPKVQPQYEIRYMYCKLYDEKNVENLVNKKYNEKIKNKFHRFFSFLLERPIHNPKLILGPSLYNDFNRQSFFKSVFAENPYLGNRPTLIPHEKSILLRETLMIKRENPPGASANSNVALCYNIDEWHKLFSNFSSCSDLQVDDLLLDKGRNVFSHIYKIFSSMNIPAVYRNLKKKTKKCLTSEEFIPKMERYDLNELMHSQIIESIVDKYEMMIVFSVQYSESRICVKNIGQHKYKSLERSISSTPSIQLRLESCLTGLEAILRIIANFKIYVEKANTDDDKLLDNLEQYLRLKMQVSISDTFNNAMNFEVNIDKCLPVNACPFSSSKGKFTGKTKRLCCKPDNFPTRRIYCCNKNRRSIKLIHQNQIVYSSILNPMKLSLDLMQELMTMSRNFSIGKNPSISSLTPENTTLSDEQKYLGHSSVRGVAERFNNNHSGCDTENESSDVEFSVLRGEEFSSKLFMRNISKRNMYNNQVKLITDFNEMNILLVQQNSNNRKRFSSPAVLFSFPSFPLDDNQLFCHNAFHKIILLVDNLHDSKISFLRKISSRKHINKSDINYVDVEVLSSKYRILGTMKRSTQLEYSRNISPNVFGIGELFQCFLRDLILCLEESVLNRFDIVEKLNIKPSKLVEYSIYSTEIPTCLLNYEERNSFEHLEEHLKNINTSLSLQMLPRCSTTTGNKIQSRIVENYQLFHMVAQLCICETIRTAKHNKIEKIKSRQQKKKCYKSNYYNSYRFEEHQMNKESRPSIGKLEIEDENTGDYGKQSGKRCQQQFPPKETKVTTILPCLGTSRSIVQRSGDSLESLLDDCLENGKLMNQGDNQPNERRKTINYKMVEDTLMECLNFKGNSDSLLGMSHTILRYFTYTVFSEIKNNYYKHVSRKHRHSCCKKHQDFSIAYFNTKPTHAFPLGNVDVKHEEMECGPKPNKPRSKNDISSNQNHENKNFTADSSLSVSNIEAKISSKDAFLCNLPNAPPFILKMNKISFGTELMSEKEEASKKDYKETCAVKNDISSIMDSLELDRASHNSSTLYPTNKGYSEMSEHNLFIDNTCPTISNRDFRKFLGKSISFIKNSKDILQESSRGCFMSSPTVCLTGLSGFSISPFTMDEKDSRKRCQNIDYRPSTDILSNETSHQHQSKIPRMLHPGKYKLHTKMKNVQLTSGSKGYGKSQACSSRGCRDHCAAENNDVPINIIHNVANTCPSKTKTCAAANARSDKRGSVIKNWSPPMQSSQPPVGDCVKGIKSDPGCYCPNIRDESIPCPVRLKENFPTDEEETPKEEDNEDMCYCAPGEQPLLMKKSNIECDCANRNRCENETLVEPPVEKPNVFWALTKVSLLKDGTKNFEIIDVSPLPPGYYLMPEANNLILVGPQPKPMKAPPNKNCTCK